MNSGEVSIGLLALLRRWLDVSFQARSVAHGSGTGSSPLRMAKLVGFCALAMAATLVRPWGWFRYGAKRGIGLRAKATAMERALQGLNAMSIRVLPAKAR